MENRLIFLYSNVRENEGRSRVKLVSTGLLTEAFKVLRRRRKTYFELRRNTILLTRKGW